VRRRRFTLAIHRQSLRSRGGPARPWMAPVRCRVSNARQLHGASTAFFFCFTYVPDRVC
jgi:hypothetical protein